MSPFCQPRFHVCTRCKRTTTETVGSLIKGKWYCSMCARELLPDDEQVAP